MYGSIIEAAVRDQQNERRAHAAAARRASAVDGTQRSVPAPAALRERSRHTAKHPVLTFYRWLAAGQL